MSPHLSCPETQQVSPGAVDERIYLELMAPHAERWRSRAAMPGQGELAVEYALRRANAASRPYARKLERCSVRGCRTKCGCKGWRGIQLYTCRQHLLCAACRASRARRVGARIRSALDAVIARRRRGERIVLLTLTLRHTGDLKADRAALADGWRRFYKALHRRWGRFPYVGVWEVTPGEDGLGHIHAHVAALWPWRDWGLCRELWTAACPSSTRITFVARRRDGRESDPKSVSKYLGKYLSKGLQADGFTPQLNARVVAGTYNTRWLFASRGLWQPFQPCCRACGEPIVQAQYRWRGVPFRPDDHGPAAPRGDPQLGLALPEPNERYRGCGS